MKHKKITLMALAMSIVLSLSACGSTAETTDADTASVETTESVEETVESTESEASVPEEELSTEMTMESETESAVPETTETVTETVEPVADSVAIEVKTVAAYTYTDVSKTMYAKSTVNVRSLPSTDGDKLGSLSKNQEVTVTGQCNETGWYRIKLNDSDAYVSNKYLSSEPVATAQASTGKTKTTNTASASTKSTGDPIADAAIAKFGPNAVVFADGTIFDATTWQQVGTVNDLNGVDLSNSNITAPVADGYNRAAAEQVWSLMNAERTAAGLNALTWDENIYNFACQRAQEIVNDFSHNGCGGYGENILYNNTGTADSIHNQWYNSPGHHANYMDADYGSGACAVYVYNGTTYAVENFALATNPYATNQYRESNGETLDLSGQQAEAFDNGNTWTASNGVVVYIQSDGNLSCNESDMDRAMAAFNEYDATH